MFQRCEICRIEKRLGSQKNFDLYMYSSCATQLVEFSLRKSKGSDGKGRSDEKTSSLIKQWHSSITKSSSFTTQFSPIARGPCNSNLPVIPNPSFTGYIARRIKIVAG